MHWSLAVVSTVFLGVAAVSRKLTGTPVTPTMVFVAAGLIVGTEALDVVNFQPTSGAVRTTAEVTLALVLFSDASRIDLGRLRGELQVPVRLLGVGLPLTIVAGTVLAAGLFGEFTIAEAVVLAVLLAPTDAALGQAVVTEPRLPSRIRQGLNVESGLNDGICVPILLIALAFAEVSTSTETDVEALRIVLEEIGWGIAAGVVAGGLAAGIVRFAGARDLIAEGWIQVVPLAAAFLAYGLADPLGGSGFIAAFVGGLVFGGVLRRDPVELTRLSEGVGEVLGGVTFIGFGAVLLGPSLSGVSWQVVLYAVLSLTVVRMVPVAIALVRSGAAAPTVAFLGWFGPRGIGTFSSPMRTLSATRRAFWKASSDRSWAS